VFFYFGGSYLYVEDSGEPIGKPLPVSVNCDAVNISSPTCFRLPHRNSTYSVSKYREGSYVIVKDGAPYYYFR